MNSTQHTADLIARPATTAKISRDARCGRGHGGNRHLTPTSRDGWTWECNGCGTFYARSEAESMIEAPNPVSTAVAARQLVRRSGR